MPEDLLELEVETPEVAENAELPIEGEETPPEGERHESDKADGDKPPVTSLFQADGRKFDPQVSAALSKIKGENPELGKLLLRAVSRVGELDREFPGGLTEARELRDKVESLGGVSEIEQKLESAQEMDGLARAYMDADPAFVTDLVESSPEAFLALAPQIFQQFSKLSPEGFGSYIGRVVYGDMQGAGIPLMLMRLGDLVADKPEAVKALNAINQYLGGFKELADKPMPEGKPKAAAPKGDDLTKREEALRSREWQSERTAAQKEIVNAEYRRALAGRAASSEEKAQIQELFLARSTSAANRLFPGWEQKAQQFIKRSDKEGYLRYMKSIYRRVVPEAVTSAVNSTMRGKKAAPAAARPPAARAAAPPPAAGYSPVAKEPGTWEIDYSRTSQSMLSGNKAILQDGRRVTWR